MELLSLGKKSILIPTPGQTEQEYLAGHLMQQQWCYTCKQNDDLLFHIQQAKKFNYIIPGLGEPVYEKVIDDFLVSLNKNDHLRIYILNYRQLYQLSLKLRAKLAQPYPLNLLQR